MELYYIPPIICITNLSIVPYLNKDAGDNGYDLAVIGDTLIAPLTLYSEKFDSLDALKEAAGAAE